MIKEPPLNRRGLHARPFPYSLLSSLFFADDGVLLARNRETMQLMLDKLASLLDLVCLKLNARKNKVLIVPHLSASESVYKTIKRTVKAAGGYRACDREIEIVDEFMYLGMCIWYGWDWTRAWHSARQRARRMLYVLRQAGIQNQPLPMVYQLRYAASQVLSHLDYVSAITGVEGTGSTEIQANELIVNQLLRLVTCSHPSTCSDALKAESGTWDFKTRVRMLQLRLFVKLSMMDSDSTHFRAMCLSKQLSASRGGGALRYYTWFDGVEASVSLFDTPNFDEADSDDLTFLKFVMINSSQQSLPQTSWSRFRVWLKSSVFVPMVLLGLQSTPLMVTLLTKCCELGPLISVLFESTTQQEQLFPRGSFHSTQV